MLIFVATMPPHFPDLLGYQIPIIESIRFLSVRGPPGTPGWPPVRPSTSPDHLHTHALTQTHVLTLTQVDRHIDTPASPGDPPVRPNTSPGHVDARTLTQTHLLTLTQVDRHIYTYTNTHTHTHTHTNSHTLLLTLENHECLQLRQFNYSDQLLGIRP